MINKTLLTEYQDYLDLPFPLGRVVYEMMTSPAISKGFSFTPRWLHLYYGACAGLGDWPFPDTPLAWFVTTSTELGAT